LYPEQGAATLGQATLRKKTGSEALMVRTRRNIVTCGGGEITSGQIARVVSWICEQKTLTAERAKDSRRSRRKGLIEIRTLPKARDRSFAAGRENFHERWNLISLPALNSRIHISWRRYSVHGSEKAANRTVLLAFVIWLADCC
jgi:hypothetical protein